MVKDKVLTKSDSSPDSSSNAGLPASFLSEPNPELIERYSQSISASKALSAELEKYKIDPETIAYLVAVYRLRNDYFDTVHKFRLESQARAKDGLKKIKKRYQGRTSLKNRDKLLKSLALQISRRIVAKEIMAGRLKSRNKPHLGDLLFLLNAYLKNNTTDPFRIMAAISILFNLRTDKRECYEQKGIDDKFSKCKFFNSDKAACNVKNLFRAPCFKNERHALWKMTKRAENRFASDLCSRLLLPENLI